MSSVMIVYIVLAIAVLRVALVHQLLARQAARQRLETEIRALTHMLVASGQRHRRIR